MICFSNINCDDNGNNNRNNKKFYYNREGIIIKISSPFSTIKKVLIQDIIDKTLFVELSIDGTFDFCRKNKKDKDRTSMICNHDIIGTQWFYNHKVGDKVFFKFIKKNRYFNIYNENQIFKNREKNNKIDKVKEQKYTKEQQRIINKIKGIEKKEKNIKFKLSDD